MLVEGEARTVIKNVTDVFQAWQALHRTYSRQTLARTLRIIRAAVNPSKAIAVGEVIARINEWESKLIEAEKLGKDRELSATVKLSILTEMCPAEVNNMIFGIVRTENTADIPTYKHIRDQMISWCSNTVSSSATSMDIGLAAWHEQPWD